MKVNGVGDNSNYSVAILYKCKEMNEESDRFVPLLSSQLSQKVMQWCRGASLIQIILEIEK